MAPSRESQPSTWGRRPDWLGRIFWIVAISGVLATALVYGGYAVVRHLHPAQLSAVVTLQAQSAPGIQVTSRRLQSAEATIESRLLKLGVPAFTVTTEGDDRIVVALPEGTDTDAVAAVLLQEGQLDIYDAADFGEAYATGAEALAAAAVASEQELPSGTVLIYWPADAHDAHDEYYLMATPPSLAGDMLKEAEYDKRTNTGLYRVILKFDEQGATALAQMTSEMAAAGKAAGAIQRLVIVVDKVVESVSDVQEIIDDGVVEITGGYTREAAKHLAVVLQTGALPLKLVRVDR
jgi:protein-export membrane protein SecD